MPARQWLTETQVNTTTTNDQSDPDIAVLADSRYIIVWEDNSTGTSRILSQIYNADGTPDGMEFAINTTITTSQTDPAVTALPDGGYFVTFNYGTGQSRYMEFTADNVVQYNNFASQSAPNTDSAVVGTGLWAVEANTPVNGSVTVFQYTENAGQLQIASSFTAQSDITGTQRNPDVAQLKNGNVVVVWEDETADTVEFRIFDSAGTAVTVSDVVINSSFAGLANPEVLALENGGFVINYNTLGGGFPASGNDSSAQIFEPDGTPFGNEILLPIKTSGSQNWSVLTPTQDGGFAAFWVDLDGPSTIEGRFFDGIGNPVGSQFTAAGFDPRNVADALDAATLPDGRIVLTWQDDDIDGASDGIAQVIIDPRDGVVQGTDGDDTALIGSFFDDQILGFQGNDELFGREGDDFLIGGTGSDNLTGGEGADLLVGGAGDTDLAVYEFSSAAVTINLATFSASGGDADGDRISGIDGVFGSAFADTLTGNGATNLFDGFAGNDTINAGGGIDTVFGGTGNDTIDGGGGDDTLFGGAQNDTIEGGFNNDTIFGEDGNDTLRGGGQSDTLLGGNNNDMLFGDAGNDFLFGDGQSDTLRGGLNNDQLDGGAGNDFLYGEGQNDTLLGGLNNDLLDGGEGNDTLTGGGQVDTFVYMEGYDEDTITDFQDNIDILDLSSFGFASQAQATSNAIEFGGDVIFNFGAAGSGDILVVENITISDLQNDILIA